MATPRERHLDYSLEALLEANHIARRAKRRGDRRMAARFETRAGTADEHAGRLEALLLARLEKPAPN